MHHSPVTITLNPAIDETVFIDTFKIAEVNRAKGLHTQAGGKGINVSRMLCQFGIPNTATGFLGSENSALFKTFFSENDIKDTFVYIPGNTRSGIKIVCESSGQTTDINFPGLSPSKTEQDTFKQKVNRLIQPGRWFVLAGSLPSGLDLDFFAQLIDLLKKGGALIAVDTSGDPLKVAIEHQVHLIKPNEHELEEAWGCPLPNFSDKVAAARELQKTKVPQIILSLGSEGAVFLNPDTSLLARAPSVNVVSTVGAGDALLSGYLAGILNHKSAKDCARLASVFAWSNLENVLRTLPPPEQLLERLSLIEIKDLTD